MLKLNEIGRVLRPDMDNPYVGLRPFDINESVLFFGRNDQILELLQKLHLHRFVAVVGSSGCGKSSLLRAGVIPSLKAGYLIDDSDNWCIVTMRPGQSPLYNLLESMVGQLDSEIKTEIISAALSRIKEEGSLAIIDLLVEHIQDRNQNVFVLIDQFEELFRFTIDQQNEGKKDEAADFVHILLELSRQLVIPIYVVITMRSDFIGDCAEFYGLTEIMNQSLFLVPKLNRLQLKMAITGPATLYGGQINPALTSHLLNVVGTIKDELPLLQHALMRIWEHEKNVDRNGELDLSDFEAIGGIEKALAKHADEALEGMELEEIEISKTIFKALTTRDEHGRRTRRPILLSKLGLLTGAKKEQLLKIIHRFIHNKRSFLIANNVANTNDQLIDISHESLIRQWDQLNVWMDEEIEAANNYIRLAEAAKLHKQNKKDFLTGSELQITLNWQNEFNPTSVWANRYNEDFESAISYLNDSKKLWVKTERIELERQGKEIAAKKRQRALTIGIGLLLVAVGFASYFIYSKIEISNLKAKQKEMQTEMQIESLKEISDLKDRQIKALEATLDSINYNISKNTSIDDKNRLQGLSQQVNSLIDSTQKTLDETNSEKFQQTQSFTIKEFFNTNDKGYLINYTSLVPFNHFISLPLDVRSVLNKEQGQFSFDLKFISRNTAYTSGIGLTYDHNNKSYKLLYIGEENGKVIVQIIPNTNSRFGTPKPTEANKSISYEDNKLYKVTINKRLDTYTILINNAVIFSFVHKDQIIFNNLYCTTGKYAISNFIGLSATSQIN